MDDETQVHSRVVNPVPLQQLSHYKAISNSDMYEAVSGLQSLPNLCLFLNI